MEKVQCLKVNFARRFWKIDEKDDDVSALKGKDIVIAILDTGIKRRHRAFIGRILSKHSLNFISGKKNDHNIEDDCGHGTSCAGIAVGNQFKRTGQDIPADQVIFQGGVAPEAKLIVCKVAECKDKRDKKPHYSIQAIESALQHICSLPLRVHVVFMSFHIRGIPRQSLQQKINALTDQGTICVAAAGNYGAESERPIACPAICQNVIAVGAHNHQGKQINLSSDDNKVCCLALGKNVCAPTIGGNEALANNDGTSLAAPAVAGLIALIIEAIETHKGKRHEGDLMINFNVINRLLEQIQKNNKKPLYPRPILFSILKDVGFLDEYLDYH